MDKLPEEIISSICQYLNWKDLNRFILTSKTNYKLGFQALNDRKNKLDKLIEEIITDTKSKSITLYSPDKNKVFQLFYDRIDDCFTIYEKVYQPFIIETLFCAYSKETKETCISLIKISKIRNMLMELLLREYLNGKYSINKTYDEVISPFPRIF